MFIIALTSQMYAGELEATMLKTFCAGANLKALLQRTNVPVPLKWQFPYLKESGTKADKQELWASSTTEGTVRHERSTMAKKY